MLGVIITSDKKLREKIFNVDGWDVIIITNDDHKEKIKSIISNYEHNEKLIIYYKDDGRPNRIGINPLTGNIVDSYDCRKVVSKIKGLSGRRSIILVQDKPIQNQKYSVLVNKDDNFISVYSVFKMFDKFMYLLYKDDIFALIKHCKRVNGDHRLLLKYFKKKEIVWNEIKGLLDEDYI